MVKDLIKDVYAKQPNKSLFGIDTLTMPVRNPPVNMANDRVENIQPAVAIETLVLF